MGRVTSHLKVASLLVGLSVATPLVARPKKAPADPAVQAPSSEAQQRFQRALDLYQEGNLDAARAEMQRAYDMAPSYKVLYNLGQIHFELHDYPAALLAFERYLSEGGAKVPDARRTQVEGDIEKLKARVARVEITSDVARAEVYVDDVEIGSTPLAAPIVVSAGRRKIVLMKAGYAPSTRWVDVAGGDSTELQMDMSESSSRAMAPPQSPGVIVLTDHPAPTPAGPEDTGKPSGVLWGGWIVAGSFAIASGTTGALAYASSRELKTERGQLGASRAGLDQKAAEIRDLALATDICAGVSVAAAAVTVFASLSRGTPSRERATMRLVPGPGSIQLDGVF